MPPYESSIDSEIEQTVNAGASTSRLSPAEFLERYGQLWQDPKPRQFAAFYHQCGRMLNPGMSRPLRKPEIPGYYAFLLSSIPDLRLERLSWAGDQQALYVEWRASGHFAKKPFQLNVVDCFEFLEGRIIYGQAYFDTVALLSAAEPSINAIPFALSANVAQK
jgi:hypothetical protein